MIEINNSKDKDKLNQLWKQKCELRREQQVKIHQQKQLLTNKSNINEKLQTTLSECNQLNDTIDLFEKQKWRRIYEKNMFLVLNTRQFTTLEEDTKDKQLIQSLNNEKNHEQSAIIINQSQLD
jgi:hypothetical protein